MRNVDFFVVVIILGVVFFLFYSVLPIFIGKYSEEYSYSIGNDFCKSDEDCAFINNACTECSCDFIAVSNDYLSTVVDRDCSDAWSECDLYCELPLGVECVENKCELVL